MPRNSRGSPVKDYGKKPETDKIPKPEEPQKPQITEKKAPERKRH